MSEELIERIEAPRLETGVVLGHERASADFLTAMHSGRMAHAWLLSGPAGIGKATLAWRLARRVLAPEAAIGEGLETDPAHPDIRQLIAGGHPDCRLVRRSNAKTSPYRFRTEISVEDVRDAGGFLHHTAALSAWRCLIVDAADEMNTNAQNALLKVLEEPPPRTLILLVAHSPSRLLPTIRSRCRALALRPLASGDVAEILTRKNAELAPDELEVISEISEGSPGRALDLARADGLELYRELLALVEPLPRLDAERAHAVSDRFSGAAGETGYRTFLEIMKWWLLRRIREGATSREQASLEPWLKAWEKIDELESRADSVNLDRKQVVLNSLFELSAAARV